MTEAASQIAANPLERRKPGSVGKPAGAEIAIMDGEADNYRPANVERSRCGVRPSQGATTMTPLRQSPPFGTAGSEPATSGIWTWRDICFIVGRIKKADVINRGGQKVSPAEVEKALLSHPDVVQAVAFPIPAYATWRGRRRRRGTAAGGQDQLTAAPRFAREHLARFKVPGLIRIVPAIPKGPGGKINRGELATLLSITTPRSRVERDKRIWRPPARN